MLKIENLSYSFPKKDLYNKISFTLEKDQHCAFIGASGSGKSTLIDIIMDPENYMYDGLLDIDPNCRIGYVSQFSQLDKSQPITVFEYIGKDFIRLQEEIASICSELESSSDTEALLEKYQIAYDAYEALGGDDYESKIQKKLNLANLLKQRDLLVSDLSGGEFKLIQVIKEMLHQPHLMIMDEPDVFLDFENLNALKKLINAHKGMVLIVTHNRYLLNHCFNKIIHLENMELQEFDGRYMDYNFSLLQTKIELQELSIADDLEIERNDQLIEKLRGIASVDFEAARGKSLYARLKIQERLEARRIKAPFVEIKQPELKFSSATILENITILKINDYFVSFDELLLEKVCFDINSTEKVAIIGGNGTGKTTLVRKIFNNSHDAIETSEDTRLAYLSQLQGENLDENNSIYDEFFDAGFKSYNDIEAYLSGYGFDEESLQQKIEVLSGGEKNILQLAKISSKPTNFLLLDEPTSHLDTYAQIALEKAIQNYPGAILMISHDFYSIINCMDYVLIIEDKTIRKMRMKKFKRMIYAAHFDRNYLEIEQKKQLVEINIGMALKESNFELAKSLSVELEELISQL